MKKRLATVLLMAVVLMMAGCGNTNSADEQNGADSQIADNTDQTNTGENRAISAEEAENILREYLISVNNWESNYVLEHLGPVLGKIENEEIFKFEIRYTDDTDEVGGRLIDNYVITTDGERIFWYNPADDEWVEQIIENTVDADNEPIWTKGMQVDGTLFQNLNLDGVGNSDDEAYVSVYQFGDYDEKVTVISIHLGTGETMAQVFPVYGDYSLQTGRLFSEEQDDIVLQVCDLTSNYGAATVFVVSVSPAGVNSVPSIGTPLNTIESIMLSDGNIIDTSLFPNLVTDGTKIVDIEGMPRQGVLIYSVGEESEYQGLPRIFFWTDNGWTILSEGMLDISVASLWDRENAARLSSEDAAVIAGFLESGNWMEGTGDCLNDCIISMHGEEIQYASDCGTFNDTVNEKRLHLTEDQQAEANAVLEKYVALAGFIDCS